MKRIVIFLSIAFLSAFCFVKAEAQAVSLFGASRAQDTSKTKGQLVVLPLANSDSNKVLTANSSGQFYYVTKGSSIDTPTLQQVTDQDSTTTRQVTVGKITVTGSVDNGTPDAAMVVNRTLTGITTAGHGFTDNTVFDRDNSGGYAAYDVRTDVTGLKMNHIVSLQSRWLLRGGAGDTVENAYTIATRNSVYSGTYLKKYYSLADVMDYTGSGAVDSMFGIRFWPNTKANVNIHIASEGDAYSYFDGGIRVGTRANTGSEKLKVTGGVVFSDFAQTTAGDSVLTTDASGNILNTSLSATYATKEGVRDTTARFWHTITPPENNDWRNVCYGGGKFVAVAFNGTNRSMSSQDGVNWNLSNSIPASTWNSITYGDGKFVAVATTGTTTTKAAYSYDGVNWTLCNLTTSSVLYDVTYGNGLFVIVTGGTVTYSSTDGINWTSSTCPNGTWRRVRYGNGIYCAVSNATNYIMTSTDGATWTAQTLPTTTGVGWQGLTYGNGKWVATCTNCTPYKLATSIDGVTWVGDSSNNTRRHYPITYGGGYYVVVGDSGPDSTRIFISPDATYGSWELLRGEGDSFNNANMVTYGNGVYVITTNFNRIVTSGRITNLETNEINREHTHFMNGGNAFGADASIGLTDAYDLSVLTNDTTRLKIYENGNVSIGTETDNGYRLNVVGSTNLGGSTVSATGGLALTNAEHRFGTNTIYFNDVGTGPRVFGGTDLNWTIVGLNKIRSCNGFSISNDASSFAATETSAILNFKTTNQGILLPQLTTSQRDSISSPANGLILYDSTVNKVSVHDTGVWYYLPKILSDTATLDFPNTGSNNQSDLTVTITGAAVGDVVGIGAPSTTTNGTYFGFVSAANTVTIRYHPTSGAGHDPDAGVFKVNVFK